MFKQHWVNKTISQRNYRKCDDCINDGILIKCSDTSDIMIHIHSGYTHKKETHQSIDFKTFDNKISRNITMSQIENPGRKKPNHEII